MMENANNTYEQGIVLAAAFVLGAAFTYLAHRIAGKVYERIRRTPETEDDWLRTMNQFLDQAVHEERYEDAAIIRDIINNQNKLA